MKTQEQIEENYNTHVEISDWMRKLNEYLSGKKWDISGIWVCEEHPMMPIEQGYSFDCKCGGPGMPPLGMLFDENKTTGPFSR